MITSGSIHRSVQQGEEYAPLDTPPEVGVEVFRYPLFRDAWFKLPVRWWVKLYALALCGMITCYVWVAFHSTTSFIPFPGVIPSLYGGVMLWAQVKRRNGRLEVADEAITRYFGDGSAVTLPWNDVLYFVCEDLHTERKQLIVLLEDGRYQFDIPDTVEHFQKLQDIVRARATQHYKDVKRGQSSIS